MKKLLIVLITATVSFTACKKAQTIAPTTPEATFSTNIVTGNEPLELQTIELTNNSTDNSTYLWDFGNGTTSTEKNPTVSYNLHGIYNIKLTVTNANGLSSTTNHDVTILCRFKNGDHSAAVPL